MYALVISLVEKVMRGVEDASLGEIRFAMTAARTGLRRCQRRIGAILGYEYLFLPETPLATFQIIHEN